MASISACGFKPNSNWENYQSLFFGAHIPYDATIANSDIPEHIRAMLIKCIDTMLDDLRNAAERVERIWVDE